MIVETAEYIIEDLLPRALYIFLQHPLVLHVFLSVYWFIVLDCYLFEIEINHVRRCVSK